MNSSLKKKILITLLILAAAVCGSGLYLYKSQSREAVKFRRYVKQLIINRSLPPLSDEKSGLGEIEKILTYENNTLIESDNISSSKDNKKIYITRENQRLVNYTDGYMLDLPKNTKFDFSKSKAQTKAYNDDFVLIITNEYSPYNDVDQYISHYFNRFILDEGYRKANDIILQYYNFDKNIERITATVENLTTTKLDTYSYITIRTGGGAFYRLMFKYNKNDAKMGEILKKAEESFRNFEPLGVGYNDIDFYPDTPKNWNDDTKKLYNSIKNTKKLIWGIFTSDIFESGIEKTIPALEKKLDYNFSIVLAYRHFSHDFPLDFMRKNFENGKIVELTYQNTVNNNGYMFGYTPSLDIYRGLKDDQIRKFARFAKEFGKPFLFRINNEMNSDWASYSGIISMSDPDIYVDNWQRFFRIFEEEGVSNAVWIYNPHDRSYPPAKWNDSINYYPGNEYVQMFGVTGYNNGTYYSDLNAEKWREFDEIYGEIDDSCGDTFGKFPWIITEFASSSVGGNKVKWIDNMFKSIKKYPKIKAAVWFSDADYDTRPEKEGIIARPYYLDETEETLNAFGRGLRD